jgi:hypothetical protein
MGCCGWAAMTASFALIPQTNVSAVYPLWRDLHLRSPATYVSSTLEIAPDRFLVGSSHGILLFDRQTRRFSVVLAAPPRLQKGDTVQLQFSGHIVGRLRDGRICVGFINWALFLLDPQTLRVTQGYDLEGRPLTGDNRGLPLPHDASQHGKAVFLDQSGSVWIFKRFSAPRRLDLATGELTFIQNTRPFGHIQSPGTHGDDAGSLRGLLVWRPHQRSAEVLSDTQPV